jgi:hypothetical protein
MRIDISALDPMAGYQISGLIFPWVDVVCRIGVGMFDLGGRNNAASSTQGQAVLLPR